MYKLVIVDDEVMVRSFLRYVIVKHDLPFEICGEGENGVQALELADKHLPDVVIMDIKMPVKDGLEAARLIKKKHPKTIVCLLTAYDYFEYAHKAIQISVDDYLLKPIKPEKIVAALQKCIREVLSQQAEQDKINQLEKQLEQIKPAIKRKLVYDFITNGKAHLSDIGVANSILSQRACEPRCMFVASLWDQDGRVIRDESTFESLAKYIDSIIGYGFFQIFQNRNAVVFGNKWGGEVFQEVQKVVRIWQQRFVLYVGAGLVPVRDGQVENAFCEAISLSKTALFWNNDGVFSLQHIRNILYGLPEIIEFQKNLFNAIMEHKVKKIDDLLNDIFQEMSRNFFRVEQVLFLFEQIVAFLLRDIVDKIVITSDDDIYFRKISKQIGDLETAVELKKLLFELAMRINNMLDSLGVSTTKQSVDWAIAYIKQNYDKNLTLEYIAKRLFLSPTYFSKIFKKYTGEGFARFVTRIRIEQAEKLLMTGNYTVAEVSRKVGFCDPSYFSTVFKKHRSLTPNEIIAASMINNPNIDNKNLRRYRDHYKELTS